MGTGTIICDWNEAKQIFLGGGIILHNPDTGAGPYTFSLLSSVIHAFRQMPGPWEYNPLPP